MDKKSLGASFAWGVLLVVLAGSVGAWAWDWSQSRASSPLPVYSQVADFSLVERSGRPFGLEDLKGRVWVASFFFSHCTRLCPLTLPQLSRLQDSLADVQFVSITVDPQQDTPPVLAELAERFHAQPARWYFLTGDQQVIYDLSVHSFLMAAEEVPLYKRTPGDDPFLHDGHFVLVDRRAQVRGFYDPLDDEAMLRLQQEAPLVVKEKFP